MKEKFSADSLLFSVLKPDTLKDIFDKRLEELKITPTNASEILQIDYRAMVNIVNGTKTTVDFINLMKLASFLQLSRSEVVRLFANAIEANFPEQSTLSPEKIKFIKENFDLAALKKAKFINSITDFPEIDMKLTQPSG